MTGNTTAYPLERAERWSLHRSELARLSDLTSTDELQGTYHPTDADGVLVGDLHVVIVQRNGVVTDRYADGTLGVSEEVRDIIGGDDALYHFDEDGELLGTTDAWLDVVADPAGRFIRAADPAALAKLESDFTVEGRAPGM